MYHTQEDKHSVVLSSYSVPVWAYVIDLMEGLGLRNGDPPHRLGG